MRDTIFLAQVTWREKGRVGSLIPGKFPVRVELNREEERYEATIPAYLREGGIPFQLAVKSRGPCSIVAKGESQELASFYEPDTGETWWVEQGSWEAKGRFHDAPSYRHPGGYVDLAVGNERYRIFVYNPSFDEEEFLTILEDLKGWCWRMAVDESCYIMLDNDAELKVLSPEFKQLVSDFNRHTAELLKLPHCELRESVAYQSLDRLRPNMDSLRFLAQRGERRVIPGRGASPHYATAENSLVLGMLTTVTAMLRPQLVLAGSKTQRFRSIARQYGKRATELRQETAVTVDRRVLDENIRRAKEAYQKIRDLQDKGYRAVRIPREKGYVDGWYVSFNPFYIVDISNSPQREKIQNFLSSRPATVVGKIQSVRTMSSAGNVYDHHRVGEVVEIFLGRNFENEYKSLQNARDELERSGWRLALRPDVLRDRKREAQILSAREVRLNQTAERSAEDHDTVATLLRAAESYSRTMMSLGVSPRHDIVPSIVFLQSPHYAGALASFRRLKDLFGLEQETVDNLLSLEGAGIRDWPAIFERWCLISLLRVLEDDFRFRFDKTAVTDNLLAYCSGKKPGSFTISAMREDLNLSLTLQYQYSIRESGREPDFLLVLKDHNDNGPSVRAVFDAKSCRFVRRPDGADANPLLYIDDSVQELLHKKDYSEGGKNRVFVLHSSPECVTHPTTVQPWSGATSCGGDAVFHWDSSAKSMPRHGYGAVMLRPHDLSHLKLIILRLIQLGLGRKDICASCGAGGTDVQVIEEKTEAGNPKFLCTCTKCSFVTMRTRCLSCGAALFKNQGYWTYHDLHPTKIWNSKCWACGTLL